MTTPLSPFRCGADNGFRFGIYLTALYAAMIFSANVAVLSIVTLALMVAVPAVVFLLLRRDRRRPGWPDTISSLWIDGLFTFLCGGLIASVMLLVYLRWIDPGYISANIDAAITTLQNSSEASQQQLADDLTTAIDNGLSLSPTAFAMSLLWLTVASGSVLSLVLAIIIKNLRIK